MMVKQFLLGGTTYEVLPLQDKFVISAKRYLGFMSLFYFRRAFLGRDETFGTKNDLAEMPSNFTFASEHEARAFIEDVETTYQAIKAL